MTTERPLLQKLTEERCWQLLEQKRVGRLAISIQNEPDVFPVNYRVDNGRLYVQTAAGIKLAAAVLGTAVAFEVDAIDEENELGWSVVVKGAAKELETLDDRLLAEDLHIEPWARGQKNRFVEIVPTKVTGRELPAS